MSPQVIIIILYLLLTVAIGLYAKRKTKSASAYHGANLGLAMCVFAGGTEWLGGTSTTGVSEYGYEFGISGSWYTIANGIGVIFLAIFFAKLYRSLDTVTVPGIVERFIGVNARIVASVLLTFVMIAVGTSQVVAAGSLAVSVFGIDYHLAVVVLGIGFILYTLGGGMTAVGYTNTLHLTFMYGGVLLAVYLVNVDVGGYSTVRAALPDSYFSMTSIGLPKVSGWIIASILGACTAQAGIQPILAARDMNTARNASFVMGLVIAPFGLLTAYLGMAAKIKFPGLISGKQALPTLMMDMHPIAGGIVLSAIVAAILSTISPIILACGTMLTKDIYHRVLRPDATDAEVLGMSRITTACAGVVCILGAIALYGSSRILDIVYFAYTLRGCLFVILLLGIYWRSTNERGAIYAMLFTAAVGFGWVAWKAVKGAYPIHPQFNETYASVIVALVSTIAFSVWFGKNGKRRKRA